MKADIIFENNPALRLSFPRLIFQKPLIVVLHTFVSRVNGKKGIQDKVKTAWLNQASRVIACSDVLRIHSWPTAKVISNPYQDDVFKVMPGLIRSKSFVFLGRLVSDKGCDIAIKAFKQVFLNGLPLGISETINFTIIGDGPERKQLENLVEQLDLVGKVIFIGLQTGQKLVAILNKHKSIVVPSVWDEPFGLVVLEGMACGCIPIVSNKGGLPMAAGAAGLVFESENINALAKCMMKVLLDDELQKKLSARMPLHLNQHLSTTIATEYLDEIENMLKHTN